MELGIESFIEALASRKPLYEHFSYRVLFKISFDGSKTDPSDGWRKLKHELGPVAFFAMWRPATRVFENGKTVLPWDISKNVPFCLPSSSQCLTLSFMHACIDLDRLR